MTNLVVTSAGRRRYVVEALLAAAGPNDQLIVMDRSPNAPALSVPGTVPIVSSPKGDVATNGDLASVKADAVISLHDYETIALARRAELLRDQGINFIGPDEHSALTVLDKFGLAAHILATAPDLSVDTRAVNDIPIDTSDEWLIKDRFGSGSSGLRLVKSRAEAEAAQIDRSCHHGWHPEYETAPIELVAQPVLSGQEYNIDLFIDAAGDLRGHCLKRKDNMRGGETDSAVVQLNDEYGIVSAARRAVQTLSITGNVDVDIIANEDGLNVLDINPRFGGGYAFSAYAGYAAAAGVWSLARGEAITDYYSPMRHLHAAKYVAVTELLTDQSGITR